MHATLEILTDSPTYKMICIQVEDSQPVSSMRKVMRIFNVPILDALCAPSLIVTVIVKGLLLPYPIIHRIADSFARQPMQYYNDPRFLIEDNLLGDKLDETNVKALEGESGQYLRSPQNILAKAGFMFNARDL